MNRFEEILGRIKRDKQVKLIGFYGSHANKNESELSDIDLFIILSGFPKLEIEGIHYKVPSDIEIDFLLISEKTIHEKQCPEYLKACILSNSNILYSNCDICQKEILKLQKSSTKKDMGIYEAENIVWHLEHIISKAEKREGNSVEVFILWSKFVYFLCLLWPRFYGAEVQGELKPLSSEYGEPLKEYLESHKRGIPAISEWHRILDLVPLGREMRKRKLFCEIIGLIQPYSATTNDNKGKERFKRKVKSWLDE